MELDIPSAAVVRQALADLSLKQLEKLAELSGVPMATIYKIRLGDTENPGIETVRKFAPHITAASAEPTKAAA
jgi:transcriptional regulator with XRE-family HTH domain